MLPIIIFLSGNCSIASEVMNMTAVKSCYSGIRMEMPLLYGNCRSCGYAEVVGVPVV